MLVMQRDDVIQEALLQIRAQVRLASAPLNEQYGSLRHWHLPRSPFPSSFGPSPHSDGVATTRQLSFAPPFVPAHLLVAQGDARIGPRSA